MKTTTITRIDAPADRIFFWLEDNECLKKWVPNLVEDVALVEKPEKVGSRFRQTFVEKGREMEFLGEITEYRENERLRAHISGDMFDLDVDYHLKPVLPDQTELTQHTQIRFKGGFKFFAPIMRVMSIVSSRDPQAEAHAKLKAMVEAEYQMT